MLTNDLKRRLAAGGMFAMPIALVLATGFFIGGPGTVLGELSTPGSTTTPVILLESKEDPLSPAEVAALEHIVSLRQEPFGKTPLYHRTVEGTTNVDENPELPPPPSFVVQAILSTASGNTALIGGEPHRVGDDLLDGEWLIISIDRETRSVTIEDPESGRTVTEAVAIPQ